MKIGGDAGGGYTKFYYQIVNVSRTNSKYNTTAFCVYEADESVPNLAYSIGSVHPADPNASACYMEVEF